MIQVQDMQLEVQISEQLQGLSQSLTMSNKLEEVVVAHRDRLCRFAFKLIQWILEKNQVKLVVLNEGIQSSEQELAKDLLSIVHIFSCRQMGKRRYKKTEKKTKTKKS